MTDCKDCVDLLKLAVAQESAAADAPPPLPTDDGAGLTFYMDGHPGGDTQKAAPEPAAPETPPELVIPPLPELKPPVFASTAAAATSSEAAAPTGLPQDQDGDHDDKIYSGLCHEFPCLAGFP